MLKKIADFIIFTNIYVALAVVTLTFETSLVVHNNPGHYKFPLFVFFCTLFLYDFHRAYHINKNMNDNPGPRHIWFRDHQAAFYIVLITAFCGVIYSVLTFLTIRGFLFLLPIGFISFGYSIPLIKTKEGWIQLRDIPGIKVFLIALVLGLVTVLLPAVNAGGLHAISNKAVCFVFFRRILFIFAITVPFDIRDVKFDGEHHIRTLPLIFGIKRSKVIALIALSLFIVLTFFQYYIIKGTGFYYMIALILSAFAAMWSVSNTYPNKSDYFFSFLVEGTMIFQSILILTAHWM